MTACILIREAEDLVAMQLRFVLKDVGHEPASARRPMWRCAVAWFVRRRSTSPWSISLQRTRRRRAGRERSGDPSKDHKSGHVRTGWTGAWAFFQSPEMEWALKTAIDCILRRRQARRVQYAPPDLTVFVRGAGSRDASPSPPEQPGRPGRVRSGACRSSFPELRRTASPPPWPPVRHAGARTCRAS